jgi:hypothetical protein
MSLTVDAEGGVNRVNLIISAHLTSLFPSRKQT